MTSFKARFFNCILRNRHLFQGRLKKETFDFDTSIEAFRAKCEAGAARFGKLPKNIVVEQDTISGINAEWIRPENANDEKLIFYVHGGGYVSGSCSDHRNVVAKIAALTGVSNLVYEYRLAPEHPFPAAIDDSVKVYQEVLNRGFNPENIIVMGESAGGGLALALLLALKEKFIAMPKAAVAISPWTDLSCSSESYKTKNRKSLAPLNSWNVFSKYYVGDSDVRNQLISPLFGDLTGLPPIFINSGEDDELFDDGRLFCEKAREAQVEVTFRKGEKMVHCYPLMAPMFNEATDAMSEILEFARKQLNTSK